MNPLYPNPDPIQSQDEQWMMLALHAAHCALRSEEIPVGACLVANHKCIGVGYNQSQQQHDPTAHAEIQALRQGSEHMQNHRLPHSTLYVTLEPCLMCLGALLHARVERIVFGVFDHQWSLTQPPLTGQSNHTLKWTPGVLASEAQALLDQFFQQKRSSKT